MVKAIKRNIFLFTIFLLSFSFAGCGKESVKENVNAKENEIITIRVLENDTAKKEGYFETLLEAFNEAYKDEGIVAVDADMDEYSDLAQNGPYGYGPDVLYQANDVLMRYAADKHILPIDVSSFECYSQIPESAWDAYKISVDGNVYTCGIPVNIQEPMLFYRKDKLPDNWKEEWDDNKNEVPDFFENFNDLYKYSKLLRDTDSSVNKDSQYGFMASYNDLYLNGEFFFSYGGYVFSKDENGIYNPEDIGLNKGNAAKGLCGMKQFAYLMNEGAIDDSITASRYEKVANGSFFCAVSTPDTYVLFVKKLALVYEEEGLTSEEAMKKAEDNLMMIELPGLMPLDGDMSKDADVMKESDFVKTVVMGGINGYAISSYTKQKDACIKFVDFATSYEMINTRMEMLGIAPARKDVAAKSGGVTDMIFNSLKEGRIYLMPSIKEIDQVWTPTHTFLSDVAKDAFRASANEEEKYIGESSMQNALDSVSKEIYDAIYTMAK